MLLRAKALELGLPYQTLIGSILHQYAEGKVKASF
jgi:predicted DNA binding CopG/RHH family protein